MMKIEMKFNINHLIIIYKMLSHLIKSGIRNSRGLLRPTQMISLQKRFYYPDNVLMKRHEGEYFSDPKEVAERIVRLIALHDNVKDPSAVILGATFEELGFNSLDLAEITLAAEKEFDMEISEEDVEGFATVNDLVENIARNFYAK